MYQYSAKVERVVDGDTIDVALSLGFDISYKQRIRLNNIDAPESRTRNLDEKKYGLEAKEWLKHRLEALGNKIVLQTTLDNKGKFGRVLGSLVDPSTGVNINQEMVDLGLVTEYHGEHKAPWEERKSILLKKRSLL